METMVLYKNIMQQIIGRIENGQLKAGNMLPSEADLCKEYNVSRITAKKALNELEKEGFIHRIKGKGSFVSENTIKKSNQNGKLQNNVNLVTLVMPFESSRGGGIDLIHGASVYLEEHGFIMNVKNSMNDLDKEKEILLGSSDSLSSGIIFYPISDRENTDVASMLSLNKYPIVCIDKYFETFPIDYVVSDNVTGTYESVSHLVSKGHRNIAFICDSKMDFAITVRNRFLGYCNALKDKNIEIRYENYIFDFLSVAKNYQTEIYETLIAQRSLGNKRFDFYKYLLDGFLDRPEKITAIQTINDNLAMEMMKTAQEMGLCIPRDISFVGFDNVETSQYLDVPLTTVEQDFYQIGYKAAEILVKRINGSTDEHQKIYIPTKLVQRQSVLSLHD